MKRILCATDYSSNSITALKYAYGISKNLDAKLFVTHIFDYPTILLTDVEEPLPDLEADAYRAQNAKLKKFCSKHLGANLGERNVVMEAVEDKSVVNGIVSKADEIHAFMIVVGMKGSNLLKELIMGNTTKKLIDKAHCLVLAVPEYASYEQINTIVYATDYEADADIEVIQKIAGIAQAFDATINVVHISTKKEYAGESQMAWFKAMLKEKVDYEKITFEIIFSETIYESLRIYLGDIGADLVVMLEREKRGFLRKWFHQDLVKKLEAYGRIPLMSFNENNFGMFHFLNLK